MKRINHSMVCREVSSLAKGINRSSVTRGCICDGHDDSGLMLIKFSCKIGFYKAPGTAVNDPEEIRFIFPTREDAAKVMQTIFETAKEQLIIQITARDYRTYSETGGVLQTYSGDTVTYVVANGHQSVNFKVGDYSVAGLTAKDNGQLIDLSDAQFITEEYAATVSGLQYYANTPYGSLVIIAIP